MQSLLGRILFGFGYNSSKKFLLEKETLTSLAQVLLFFFVTQANDGNSSSIEDLNNKHFGISCDEKIVYNKIETLSAYEIRCLCSFTVYINVIEKDFMPKLNPIYL